METIVKINYGSFFASHIFKYLRKEDKKRGELLLHRIRSPQKLVTLAQQKLGLHHIFSSNAKQIRGYVNSLTS